MTLRTDDIRFNWRIMGEEKNAFSCQIKPGALPRREEATPLLCPTWDRRAWCSSVVAFSWRYRCDSIWQK